MPKKFPVVPKAKKPILPVVPGKPKKKAIKNRWADTSGKASASNTGISSGGEKEEYKSWQPKAVDRRAYEIKTGAHPINRGKLKKNRGR